MNNSSTPTSTLGSRDPSESIRLLLAEDEQTQRMALERQLTRAGYAVDTARNGTEALEKILTGQFQLLVTDWEMPVMDGPTLCRQVREAQLPGYVYILLLTANDLPIDIVTGLESGADDYVKKPAHTAELLARLNTGRRIVRLERSLRQAHEQVQRLSITDALVDSYNRRYLNQELVCEIERAWRDGRPLSVLMADLDRFKSINDAQGHQAGDDVLRRFVDLARACLRQSDWIARYGGEEFVMVLPDTPLIGAQVAAEKIRSTCAATALQTSTGAVSVTVSIGVSELPMRTQSPSAACETLLRSADSALYESKRAGRNRVTVTSPC